jgi:NAD(P)-dependent dehydrogenase (short-subunit alcohol dehydrogenase family)
LARIFITGSADGLGQLAARRLVALGHDVVLHGRNRDRAQQALRAVPGARTALEGDLTGIEATRALAAQANEAGPFQAVIHNAGVYHSGAERHETVDGLDDIFAVNALAPYLLTALIEGPQRLIYLTSGLHQGGDPDLNDLQSRRRRWSGPQAYANSKLFDVVLAFAVARLLPDVLSNAVDPGWVPTKMGGPSAPDDPEQGVATQVWLAVSDERGAKVTGRYFYHMRTQAAHRAASDVTVQNAFLATCEQLTGVRLASAVTKHRGGDRIESNEDA